MSAPASTQQNTAIPAAQNASASTSPAPGQSTTVAAGSAQPPAARYANATKNLSSPPIASSAAPPVAVGGGSQNTQHGKRSSISPVNGKPIQPAVPAVTPPAIANSSTTANGAASQGDHSRKSSVTYMANGGPVPPSSRPPKNLTFGSLPATGGSPAPSTAALNHPSSANLNPQANNPRVTSPAHSPSPIPQPASSGGRPPSNLSGQTNIVFGSDGAESSTRPVSMPPQQNHLPQAQHLRRESSQSAHSDMGNHNMNANRGYPPQGGRGRGFTPGYNAQIGHGSPGPNYRPLPNQQRGPPTIPPSFQPAIPNSPYRQTRSPAMAPVAMHQQTQYANQPSMPYGTPYGQPQYNQHAMYGLPPQAQQLDPAHPYAYYPQHYQMQPQMYNGMPASPGRGNSFPPHMQGQFVPGYGQPQQGQSMSRSPSQVSERPSSAVAQPQTPAMSNVNHVSHTHTPSASSASPAPSSSTFAIPPKKASKAIVIKNDQGEVVNFNTQKTASPAPPTQPRSPAIVSTPTPPPRAPSAAESSHSRTESIAAKTSEERKKDFLEQFQQNLKEKEEAEKKAAEEQESKSKADADAEATKEKEDAELKAAKEREEAEKASKEKDDADKEAKEKEEAERKKREEDERLECEIAEMVEREREEEERERQYQEKKKKEAEEKKAREAEAAKRADEELRRQEREAEEREEARAKESAAEKSEKDNLFASLKKNTQFGPAASMPAEPSGASMPTAETAMPPPSQPLQPRITSAGKPKPAALKLETAKPVEPAQPTPGMQSLKSARFLQVKNEAINYPNGIKSPNPALNQGARSRGKQYDKDFLLQFQEVFKEKPSMDWDQKLKETVGDPSDSARPQSARTPSMGMGGRSNSRPGGLAQGGPGVMGMFTSGRTLPPGTTSEQRYHAATGHTPRQTMTNPLAHIGANRTGGFPMGIPGQMNRTSSFQNMGQSGGPNSPRTNSRRGGGSRKGGPGNRREEEQAAKSMPLTAGMDLKPLETSQTGWKPMNVGKGPAQQAQVVPGHMAPDMVQRKVKAALNKMTPEKFDKIADQILEIAAQSKDESDGRTLRQVIQLTFEKACDEAHWASMYAKFCHRMLTTMSPDIKDENVKDKTGNPVVGGALFRKYLLNRCQEEFERGWEVNLPQKPEGEQAGGEAAMLSDEYYIAAAAKRKGLGLIQFIGELYKLGMLTLRIMHECVLKLLDFEGMPDESAIESLVKLLRTVGATMEQSDSGPKMIALYFERIQKIMNTPGLPSRLHFMLLDTVDLRRKGWKSKDDAKGPKTLAEIHQEAQAAQQAAEMERSRSNRGGPRAQMGRGDARSFSGGMMPPPDYPRDRVGMDDLRRLSKGPSARNLSNSPAQLGPSMLGSRSSSGRRGLGPNTLMNRGEDSGNSSRTGTPPVQKEKETHTHANSFSALAALEDASEGAGQVGSPPSTASSPPVSKSIPLRAKSPAVEGKDDAKASQS